MFITPASLLFRLQDPEQAKAWERFVDLYTPLLLRWARQLGEQESDSEDLVQEVFLILWRKLPEFQYDPSKSFHSWLKTVFLNCFRSRQRKRHHLVTAMDDQAAVDQADCLADEEESNYLIRQAFRLIEREFSPLQQQIFRQYVIEEREPDAVAQSVGVKLATVYSVKSKVLRRLRDEIRFLLD